MKNFGLCLEICFFGWAVHPEYTPSIPTAWLCSVQTLLYLKPPHCCPTQKQSSACSGAAEAHSQWGGCFQITSEGQWHHQNSLYMKEMKVIIKILLTKSFKSSFQQHITLLMYQTMKASNSPKQNSNLQSKAYEITEHNGRIRWEHISLPSTC